MVTLLLAVFQTAAGRGKRRQKGCGTPQVCPELCSRKEGAQEVLTGGGHGIVLAPGALEAR